MGGFFWLPCPMCGKMFGGHEKGSDMLDPDNVFIGKLTCADPVCIRQVKEYNKPIREKQNKAYCEAVEEKTGQKIEIFDLFEE